MHVSISYREVGVVPPAVTVSGLVLYGEVAGWLLWPILSFPSFPPPAAAVFFI